MTELLDELLAVMAPVALGSITLLAVVVSYEVDRARRRGRR